MDKKLNLGTAGVKDKWGVSINRADIGSVFKFPNQPAYIKTKHGYKKVNFFKRLVLKLRRKL